MELISQTTKTDAFWAWKKESPPKTYTETTMETTTNADREKLVALWRKQTAEEDGDGGRPHCDDCDAWSMTTAHRHWTPDGEHMYCDDCADQHEDEFVEDETEHKPCAVCAVDTDYMICANECGAFHCARHSTESHLCRSCEEATCANCKGEFGEDCPFASTRDTTLCKDCYLNSHLDEDETDDEE
jgi:hypothetical protein